MKELGLSLHHIGIATENIEQTAELLKVFGYMSDGEGQKEDLLQGVYVAFLKHPRAPLVELIGEGSIASKSPIREILKRNGTTVYHLCFETENIDETVSELRKQGYLPTSKKQPSLIDGRDVIFLYHRSNCLIELLGRKAT